jgi:hypothetical protein
MAEFAVPLHLWTACGSLEIGKSLDFAFGDACLAFQSAFSARLRLQRT